jgi:hypothetical protein
MLTTAVVTFFLSIDFTVFTEPVSFVASTFGVARTFLTSSVIRLPASSLLEVSSGAASLSHFSPVAIRYFCSYNMKSW